MDRVEKDGLVFYQFEQWRDAPIRHGLFTRLGGTSSAPFDSLNMGGNIGDDPLNVRANHVRMYAAAGMRDERACSVWQVHSADVVLARRPARNRRWLGSADALITDQPDLPLSMRFADCTPLFFLDRVRGAVGMAHAGWRGTVQGVGAATVRAMCAFLGSRPADIQVGIGASIGPEYYQVGEEVVAAVRRHFGETDGLIRRDPADGTAYLDLWEANRRDVMRAGVEQVEVSGLCTVARNHEFFSHRAEKGRTGRFGAVISL
ncbi:MAG: peptidoglycan editing factor PgeF [Pleurocapsa minor GSE-CHR-MK-17-07R]|nr:peptidoglycan editing factor PgeF [Pleurocapsa minor GSE-CHR-MK 17-07R]